MRRFQRATFFSIVPFLVVPLLLSTVQLFSSVSTVSPKDLAASKRTEARVTRVIDGANIEVDIAGETFQVVYAGLEVPQPVGVDYLKADVFYAKGTVANADLVAGKTVILERDVTNVDAQGRLVRWVWQGGTLVNQTLAFEGMAWVNVTPPDNKHEDQLVNALTRSRVNGNGMWDTSGSGETDCATCAYLQAKAEEELKAKGIS